MGKKGVKGVEGGCDGPIGEKGRGRGAADAINDNKKGAPASSHLCSAPLCTFTPSAKTVQQMQFKKNSALRQESESKRNP